MHCMDDSWGTVHGPLCRSITTPSGYPFRGIPMIQPMKRMIVYGGPYWAPPCTGTLIQSSKGQSGLEFLFLRAGIRLFEFLCVVTAAKPLPVSRGW